jgi:segregation and condensation protein B
MNVNALEILEPSDEAFTAEADPMMDRLAAIVESLLFAASGPVPVARLVQALDGHDRREVAAALRRLGEQYEGQGRGLRVVEVAGGFQIRTAPEHGPWVRRLLGGKPPRLSRPMLETLAIIAYRQPCTRPEIEAIRGVDVDAVIATLLERRMIRIVGRKEAPGRPILYGTTAEFLEVFGLPDLDALPTLRDLGDVAEVLRATDMSVTAGGVVPTPEAVGPELAPREPDEGEGS